MKKKTSLVILLSVLFIGAIVVLRLESQKQEGRTTGESKPMTVGVSRVCYGSISAPLRVTGTLEGAHEADVISETNGKIVKLDAEVDCRLPRDGTIATVENDLQEISLEQARAQVVAAQASSEKADLDLKRVVSLHEQDAVSEAQLENAQLAAKAALAQYKGAEAAERLAKKSYDDTFLKTPIAGRLAQRFVTLGLMVSPGMKVATVVDDAKMKLKVGVPEEEVSLIEVGNRVKIDVDAVPGKEFDGRLTSVSLKADPMTRTFQVEIEMVNDEARSLKSGMFARADIKRELEKESLVVPSNAVIESNGASVFVVKDSIATLRHVVLGLRNDSLVHIASGLIAGELVVSFGQQNLRSGTRVSYNSGE